SMKAVKAMKPVQPTPILDAAYSSQTEQAQLTSAEQGKLWAAYMGNSMGACVLQHMLEYTDDADIRQVVEHALNLARRFLASIKEFYVQEKYPIPQGFNEHDVHPGAGRLFVDEFYLHYLRYTSKAGMSIYGIAVSLMSR